MKLIVVLGLFFTMSFAHAKGLNVDWVCPKDSSQKTAVEVSFDDQGKLQFKPDVFDENQKTLSAAVLSACIADFQKLAGQEIAKFKQSKCPASKDDFCYSSVNYANGKILEKIQKSNLIKKNSAITVSEIKADGGSGSGGSVIASGPATAQAFLEEKIAKKEIDPKNLSQTFQFQNKSYKVSDFDGVVGDHIENVFVNLNRDEAKQYAQNYMVAKSDLLKANKESPQRTAVLNNLNQMFGYIYGDKGAEELAKILECKPEDNLKPIEDIIKKIEETNKVSKCDVLKPGEHKVFQKENNNYYGTGNYTLKRKQDGNYQAILNVKFKQGNGATVAAGAMLERSQKCLALAAPHMKGPDGKTIEMVVMPPDEINKLPKDEQPKQYEVSIEPPGYGTNAGAYAQTVDCATITHEMLHLMGLCDEYKEDRPEYAKYNWTCRVATKAPSIMRDLSVFNKAVGKAVNCECSGQNCSAIMNSTDENAKKLYTAAGFNDAIDYRFRNSYCKEEYVYNPPKVLTNPDKAVVLESQSDLGFVVQGRYLLNSSKAPFYSISHSKIKCNCPANDQDCLSQKKRFLDNLPNLGVKSNCPNQAPYISADRGDNKTGATLNKNVLTLISQPTLPSLLQPNHFNKILEGTCAGKSEGYQQCAEHAYKGEPCNVPAKCLDDKYYLGSEQQ